MLMNFGPINQTGGERRLNVAFSRARKHMALVSSIRAERITNDYNDGARALKNYLRYAEAQSQGDVVAARRILRESNPVDRLADDKPPVTALSIALADRLRLRGYSVESDVGESEFRVDLALRRPGEADYALGLLLDGERYCQTGDALERDVLRPGLLRNFGWKVALCLSKDWLSSPDATFAAVDRILKGTDDDLQDASMESAAETPALAPGGSSAEASSSKPSTVTASGKIRLEHVDGSARKFWEIEVSGNSHTVRFGRIGTQGQSKTKSFPDETSARRDADRLLREKRAKGYVDHADSD